MQLMKLKYKDFTFPSNPESIKIKYQNNVSAAALFGSDSSVQNVSRNACAVSASGAFFGGECTAFLAQLEALYKDKSAGFLFLPNGACITAFFSALSYEISADKSAVQYSLEFKEDCRHTEAVYDFGYTYAESGENAFHIAARTGVAVEKIIELNALKNAFDLSEGDRVVLR